MNKLEYHRMLATVFSSIAAAQLVVAHTDSGGTTPQAAHPVDLRAVSCVAFSSDGATLAVGGSITTPERRRRDGVVLLLDLTTGKEKARLVRTAKTPNSDSDNVINCLAFSPDGNTIAAGDWLGATIWNPATGKSTPLPRALDGVGDVKSIAFSPDGKLLAIGVLAGIEFWDAKSNHLIRNTVGSGGSAIAFSPDGKFLASAEGNNRVHVWNAATAEQLAEDHAMMGPLYDIAFSPDGKSLTSVGGGGAKIWNVTTAGATTTLQQRVQLNGHMAAVRQVAYSSDGRLIVTSSADASHKLWDASTGRIRATLVPHVPIGSIGNACFSPDGKQIAAGGMQKNKTVVMLWNVEKVVDPKEVHAQTAAAIEEALKLARAGEVNDEQTLQAMAGTASADQKAVGLLTAALQDHDDKVRQVALMIISVTAFDEQADVVLEAVRKTASKDQNPTIRQIAVGVVERLTVR